MESTLEDESPTRRRLTVEVSAEEVAPAYDVALKRLAREVKIPGFRPGKAPKAVIESRVGKDAIKDEVLRNVLPSFYSRAATEHSLEPLAQPEIEVTQFEEGEALTFVATVEVRPQFRLPEYKGIEVSRPAWAATDEELQQQIDRLRDQFGTLEEVPRAATKGDFVSIDIFATRHGQKIEAATANDLVYELGSGSFVPEMDAELEGKRTGDIVKFNARLPEALGGGTEETPGLVVGSLGAGGKPEGPGNDEATFQVVVKQVQAKKLPPADDEFAKLASEFDTLEDLKAELHRRIESMKKSQADLELQNKIMEELVDSTEVPIPESLLEKETQARLSRLIRELERAGLTLEQYLQVNESTEEELVQGARDAAEKIVAVDLILEEIAEVENLTVENRDIAIEVAAAARQTGREVDELLEELKRTGQANLLAGDILRRKALNFLVEHANIEEEGPGTAIPAEPEPSDHDPKGEAVTSSGELEAPNQAPEEE